MSIVSNNITSSGLISNKLIGLNIGGSGSSPAFSPTQLSGLNLWYDISDLSTMWTTSGKTTQVASDGDPVGYIEDKSGNGLDATASGAQRPTYKTDGTYHWLSFDGSNQYMDIPVGYDGVIGSDNMAVSVVQVTGLSFRAVFGATGDEGFEHLMQNGFIRPYVGTTGGDIGGNGTTDTRNTDIVYTSEWDRSAGTLKGWQNQSQEVDLSITPNDKQNGAAAWFGSSFSAGTAKFQGRIYNVAIYTEIASAADKALLEDFMAGKAGITL